MRCLNCDAKLNRDEPDENSIVHCPCGVDYATLFLDTANEKEWEKVRKSKRFMRNGPSISFFNNKVHGS